MHTKAGIFNLALNALLLRKRITDTVNDKSNENLVLNANWEIAFNATLEDLDLDSTSTSIVLELIAEDPTTRWSYAYAYPDDCAFLRRIETAFHSDTKRTHIEKRIGIYESEKVIFTNEANAVAEYISTEVPLTSLSATVGLAMAYRLAMLSAPLITGKGAKGLIENIQETYKQTKSEAQEQDRNENFNFRDEEEESEFVAERLS